MRLIRRFVFWLAEYFPFLFPLLLAAFFLVQINTAFAADEVPADSKAAKLCNTYLAGWSGLPAGTEIYGCSRQEAGQSAFAAMTAANQTKCTTQPEKFKECAHFDYGETYWTIVGKECTSYYSSGGCASWSASKTLHTNSLTKKPGTYQCPPGAYPDYTIGPLTKSDNSKWCAKAPTVNPCEDKANTPYSTPVHFYALNLSDGLMPTCKDGCEVQSSGTGTCQSITLPSGTKASKCLFSSAVFSGNQCPFESGEEPATGTGEDVGTPEQPSNTEQECVPSYNAATGVTSCTGVKKTENPGTSSCGSINGTWTCVPNDDGGSSTTTDHREITNSTDPATGNTTTTDRTTSSTVTCKGDDCTTSAKTTTTTTVKGPDGSVISSSTDCVGAGCGSGAPGDPDAPEDELTPPEYPDMPNPQDFTDDVNEGVDGYEDSVMGQFERDDYEYVATIDPSTSDKVSGAITANISPACVNPTIPVGLWTFTVDMCYYSSKIRPYLDFMCVMLTLIYCWHLLRESIYTTGA